MSAPVIALDGPGGSGKGTVARAVSERLGYHLLDSGAIYRVLALAVERDGLAIDDIDGLTTLARGMRLNFRGEPGAETRAVLDGVDVTDAMRTEACGERASQLAAQTPIREALLERQRAFCEPPGLVADGRDMGTVVFPDALVKVFLYASVAERAARRHKQLNLQGGGVSLADLLEDIAARDRRDRERPISPLVPASDAVMVDTTGVDVETAVEKVLSVARARGVE